MERRFASALVLFAHPDDAEFSCGATVAKWAAQGCDVTYVVITDGSAGSNEPGAERAAMASLREDEQRSAAHVLGVSSVQFLGETDGHLEVNDETRRKVCRMVRRFRPEVLVAPDPSRLWSADGYINHRDHKQAGLLGLTAVMPDAPSRPMFPDLLDEGYEPYEVPNLYLMTPAEPDLFVDVSDTFDRKLEALAAHASQGTDRMLPLVRERAEQLAAQAGDGVRYAEAFKAFHLADEES
jgi:LmbE family N-acetylglucosaminyl deacetylase